MIEKIKINGNEYELNLTFKALASLGFVKNDLEANMTKLTSIYASLTSGDVFSVPDILTKLTGKTEKEIQKDLENEPDVEGLFDKVYDFLTNQAMLKRWNKLVVPEVEKIKKQLVDEANK